FRNTLNRKTGLKLPASLIYDYPTLTTLTHYLHKCYFEIQPPNGTPVTDVNKLREIRPTSPIARSLEREAIDNPPTLEASDMISTRNIDEMDLESLLAHVESRAMMQDENADE
ncbi:acyl carrier protein, partial [Mycobacterium marinum]|uniref:acyl carrier protein n=1 Tax=Mycobacterium marinum TaxID=1781 RepID=UPI00137B3D86